MTSTLAKTDHQIQTAIVKELDWSPGVESEHIGVAVSQGAVTLSGEVSSLPQRNAAVAAALRIHCVVALVDDIAVTGGGGRYNDADIARDVNHVLGRLVQLEGVHVHATVHAGVVTLGGTVDWRVQRDAARRSVESIRGVIDVRNEIALSVASPRADAEAAIRAAVERGARRDAERIGVAVDDHRVTLSGSVTSLRESREAENAAWAARGITHVVNDLRITP